MSIKIPKLDTKIKKTSNTSASTRRYKAPTRSQLMKKFASLKKGNRGTNLDKNLQAKLIKNVLANTKIEKV
jgi:hypothetical protein|tara:strand:- start:29 stop:241 length:213 start_codon:yes stop_codon:yes gene_type:complete